MLRVTRLTDYATAVLCELAKNTAQRASAHALALQLGMGLATVSKVLKLLSHAGLVTAVRGADGGYTLGRAPHGISLVDIIEALEGPLALTDCALPQQGGCDKASTCHVRGHWQAINQVIWDALQAVTLAHLSASTPFSQSGAWLPINAPSVTSQILHVLQEPSV